MPHILLWKAKARGQRGGSGARRLNQQRLLLFAVSNMQPLSLSKAWSSGGEQVKMNSSLQHTARLAEA